MALASSILGFASFFSRFLNLSTKLHLINVVNASFTFYPDAAEVYKYNNLLDVAKS
jgi:hypothetical protein